jgi:GntR family transcriptional regulator / MocR family aminotransferase
VGTASKTLAPALRLAWAIVPSHLVGEVAATHGVARAGPSVLMQATYATLLERGDIDRHLRRTRRRYHARRNALIEALSARLPQASAGGTAAGLHLMAWMPDGTDETAIVDAAADRGVAIHTLREYCAVAGSFSPALLLGYGAIAESSIPLAVEELAIAAIASRKDWSTD